MKRWRAQRSEMTRGLALLAILVPFVSGCSRSSSTTADRGTPKAPRLARPSELTPAERQWGIGPRRGPDVTYQPDVVLIDEGPDAIVGLSANGLEWTIKGGSSHADELQPGKILFATSRAVGRILGVRKDGPNLAIVVGPVEITEVVSDLKVAFEQPIDFGEMLTYTLADPLGSAAQEPRQSSMGPTLTGAGMLRLTAGPTDRPGFLIPVRQEVRQRTFPMISSDGLGIRTIVEGNGSRFAGDASFRFAVPKLRVDLAFAGGKIVRCVLELSGAAGVSLGFEASTDRGLKGNFEVVEPSLPTDLSIPITGPSFPMTVNLRQGIYVDTGWSGAGTLTAKADFTASGSYALGYPNGKFGVEGPTNFKWTVHPLKSVGGVSLGPTGMVAAYMLKVIVGIGGFGFATGPYVRLHTSLGISRDSDLVEMRQCRAATVLVNLAGGLGYVVPRVVTNAINAILRGLNLGTIQGEGGVEVTSKRLLESQTVVPPIASCGAEGK